MQTKHPNLVVVGATKAAAGDLAKFRADTGATFPILTGLEQKTLDAYFVSGMPAMRVLGPDGVVVGSSPDAMRKALGDG